MDLQVYYTPENNIRFLSLVAQNKTGYNESKAGEAAETCVYCYNGSNAQHPIDVGRNPSPAAIA